MEVSPGVFDVYVSPYLDAPSLAKFALSSRHTTTSIHGSYNYEATRVFDAYRAYHHPANVLVRTDTTGRIQREIVGCVGWEETSDQVELATRLQMLQSVRELCLYGTDVKSVDGLCACTQLTRLNLAETRVVSIDALGSLPRLRELRLGYTPISSVDALRTVTSLRELYISGTRVSSIDALSALTNLRTLAFDYTRVTSVVALRNLTSLRVVCTDRSDKDIEGLVDLVVNGCVELVW